MMMLSCVSMMMVPWSRSQTNGYALRLRPTLEHVGSFGDYVLWMCWFCIDVRVNVSQYWLYM